MPVVAFGGDHNAKAMMLPFPIVESSSGSSEKHNSRNSKAAAKTAKGESAVNSKKLGLSFFAGV